MTTCPKYALFFGRGQGLQVHTHENGPKANPRANGTPRMQQLNVQKELRYLHHVHVHFILFAFRWCCGNRFLASLVCLQAV
jgi:hypothetical protein